MNNQDILKQAIEKAIKNGWDIISIEKIDWYINEIKDGDKYYALIFSHDFAKTFFGKDITSSCCKARLYKRTFNGVKSNMDYCRKCRMMVVEETYDDYNWKHCLREMALEKEPLKYIKRFL